MAESDEATVRTVLRRARELEGRRRQLEIQRNELHGLALEAIRGIGAREIAMADLRRELREILVTVRDIRAPTP